jgi:hypothetical protein
LLYRRSRHEQQAAGKKSPHDISPKSLVSTIGIWQVAGYPGAGPYEAKGAGEIASVPPMAAIANAIFNATGVRINKLPLSPENVLRGLKAVAKA